VRVAVKMHAHAQHGETPLIWAAENGRANCVRLLLDAGADTHAKDNVRSTRLRVCACEHIWPCKIHFIFLGCQ
jgi:hypothetical protein